MAGRGPAPAEARRRRNAPARGDWIDLEPLRKLVLPALPKRTKAEGPWSSRTRRLYDGWRRDPVTQMYGKNEIAAAIELAYLEEEMVRGTTSLASEIRQRSDGLGLTPKGKRDLRYRVLFQQRADIATDGGDDDDPEPPEPKSKRRSGGSDRRARLSLVTS